MIKKKTVFVLYFGDAWLSRSSLSVMGVFSSLYSAIDAVMENMECSDDEFEEVKKNLYAHKQSQWHDNAWLISECAMDEYGEV